MSLTNARASIEKAIQTTLKDNNPTVSVVFDNTPFTSPGKTKKYVMVSIDFNQATQQPQGGAVAFYSGSVICSVMAPKDKGTSESVTIAQDVIDALVSINSSTYVDTYSSSPRISEITGPNTISNEGTSHFVSVVSCNFTANG
tara:strand:- start:3627 stop:4055 length:429 start_codon:yes stop_codon:yes gene_type:complete